MQKIIANNTSSLNKDVTAMLCDANLDFVSILLNTAHFGRLCWNNVVSDIGVYYMKLTANDVVGTPTGFTREDL